MPWGELKKEDLIKAGLNPDDISTLSGKIANAATKDDITELKNSLQTTVDALKTLETSFRQSSTPRSEGNSDGDGNRGNDNGNQNKGNPNQPQPLNIDPLAFMEDPQGSVRRLANEML